MEEPGASILMDGSTIEPLQKQTLRRSVPSVLFQRSLQGINLSRDTTGAIVAWNPSRMQNMRLAVGPTTPASCIFSQPADNLLDNQMAEDPEEEEADEEQSSEARQETDMASSRTSRETQTSEEDLDDEQDEDEDARVSSRLDDESDGSDRDEFIGAFYRQLIPENERRVSPEEPSNPSMRSLIHGGCINTACWLPTDDRQAPTKVMTSGDDRLVKIWSVGDAMGRAWENGWDSFAPFACNDNVRSHELPQNNRMSLRLPGSVILLNTFRTGHFGNVFHVTPHNNGAQALTSAADGGLRLVSEDHSSLILQSEGMAFCHQPLTEHTGLVCYEDGLNQYDLRCSHHAQPDSLIVGSAVKACAIYRPTVLFVGGKHAELLDIRTSGTFRRYQPSLFSDDASGISVSGIDVSRDSRSLLVSYDSDQIYEFPICPNTTSLAGPTVADIDHPDSIVHEQKMFGGHLNRFTFLKNAKYAGPNDEYVVTGSDSGRAWIFRRDTSTVVALLAADSNTCNGVIPHPSLPYFISYGIDSTAKLWRAAPPYKDDSKAGRYKAFSLAPYEMSPVAKSWSYVEKQLQRVKDSPVMYPDFISTPAESAACCQFNLTGYFARAYGSPRIGNALLHLPLLLRQNRCECYRLLHAGRSVPLEQPVTQFSLNVIRLRLQHQADRLGAAVDLQNTPWILRSSLVHPADLIPDFPSDWILLDKRMSSSNLLALRDCQIPWLSEEQQTPQDGESFREKVVTETVSFLKESGNLAMSQQNRALAARRFDKAIQYCAVLQMPYLENIPTNSRTWSPLVRLLVTLRLNLSLALLKEKQAHNALEQGKAALSLIVAREETDESKKLRLKAYFRVGSAALACGDYDSALENLELAGDSDDPVLKRRRIEARQLKRAKQKRARKKYRRELDNSEQTSS